MAMRDIEIDLAGTRFDFLGSSRLLGDAIADALRQNGGVAATADEASLIVALHPLGPQAEAADLLPDLQRHGERFAAGLGGRLVLVLSAAASVPMRRHPAHSANAAMAWAGMRTLAMALAPKVLVNAVGAGFVEEAGQVLAGDPVMPGHAGLQRPGRVADLVNAVLFLADPANTYTTGQLLNVDGGWTVGYGRNF